MVELSSYLILGFENVSSDGGVEFEDGFLKFEILLFFCVLGEILLIVGIDGCVVFVVEGMLSLLLLKELEKSFGLLGHSNLNK